MERRVLGLSPAAWRRLIPPGVLLLTVLAYLPAMKAGYIWDDDFHVTNNPLLHSVDGLLLMWFDPYALPQYYPMTHTSFWVEYQLWQLRPVGYHLDNILLHGLNAILLGSLLRRLGLPFAWWAAALFAVHPVHVESVAWVSERKNLLSGFFYLLAFHTYETFLRRSDANAPSRWKWYALALLLFVAALFSKTVTSTLPGALLMTLWWKKAKLTGKDFALTLPLFAIGIVMGLTTAHIEHVKLTGGAPEFDLSAVDRLLVAGRAAWFYAAKLLWPTNLAFIYPRWEIDPRQVWQFLFPLGAVALLPAAWALRHRVGRSPLAALLFFGGTLFPALGFVDVWPMRFSFVADHFQYLASIGILALAAGVVWHVARSDPWRNTILAIAVVLLASGAFVRAFAFRSDESVWLDTLEKNPTAWLAHAHLASIAKSRGDIDKASHHYGQLLRLRPRASTHVEYGIALLGAGKHDEARRQLEAGLALDPKNAVGHNALGVYWTQRQDWQKAADSFAAAAAADPPFADAHNNLGQALEKLGRIDDARNAYLEALKHDQGHAAAQRNLTRVTLRR